MAAKDDEVNPEDVAVVDGDNFTKEERDQFAAMANDQPAHIADDAGGDQGGADTAAGGGAADTIQGAGAADTVESGAAAAAAAAAAEGEAGDDEDDDEVDGAADAGKVGADGKPRRKPPRVSGKKYATEKARADAAETALRERDQLLARADERMKLIGEALTKPKEAEAVVDDDPEPDAEKDIFGWVAWKKRDDIKLRKEIADLRAGRQGDKADQNLTTTYERDSAAFGQREPNFWPAYEHLMNMRVVQMARTMFGINLMREGAPALTKDQGDRIANAVRAEEKSLAEDAIAAKQSPAEVIYDLALTMGYTPKTREELAAARAARAPGANGAGAGNGAAKPGANGKDAANGAGKNGGQPGVNGKGGSVSEEVERIKAGSESALSLSDAGGGGGSNPMTPQRLAAMPQDQFDALMERIGDDPDEWQRLVEGQPG